MPLGGQRGLDTAQERHSSGGGGAPSMASDFRQSSGGSSQQQVQQPPQHASRGIVSEGNFSINRAQQQQQYEGGVSGPVPSFAAGMPDAAQPRRFVAGNDGWNHPSSLSSSSSQERALAAAYPHHGPARGRVMYSLTDVSSSSSSFGSHPERAGHAVFRQPSAGVEYNDVYERRRAALAARPSLPNMASLAGSAQHGGGGGDGIGGRSHHSELQLSNAMHHLHQRHREARPDNFGRRQEFDHGGSGGSNGNGIAGAPFAGRRSGCYSAEGFDPRLEQQESQCETFRGVSLDVTRRRGAAQEVNYHQEHATDRFAASYSSGGNPNGGAGSAFGRCKSFSGIATAEQQHIDGRITAEGGSCQPFGGGGGEPIPPTSRSPPFATSAAAAESAAAGASAMSTPKNPLEWLQNLNLRQSRNGSGEGDDRGATPPRTSRSNSGSPLANDSDIGAAGGAVSTAAFDMAGFSGRSELLPSQGQRKAAVAAAVAAAAGSCPAPDCTANSDCVPGASPETLVYEVNFKRATRTFLPGDKLNHDCISCGALMIVSETAREARKFTILERCDIPRKCCTYTLNEFCGEKKTRGQDCENRGQGWGARYPTNDACCDFSPRHRLRWKLIVERIWVPFTAAYRCRSTCTP